MPDDVPLPPLALALLDAAASVEDDGDVPLKHLIDQAVQSQDGDALLDHTIRHAPNLTLAQRLDIGAWLMASQRTFATSAGDITHLVFVIPMLMAVPSGWTARRNDPASLRALGVLEQGLREHGLARREAVLWTLPYLYDLNDLLGFTPIRWRRLNTAAFRRVKAVRHQGWTAFDLNDPVWGVPPASPPDRSGAAPVPVGTELAALGAMVDTRPDPPDGTVPPAVPSAPAPGHRMELRFLVGGVLDRRPDALALWEEPDPDDAELVSDWNDTLDLWAQDAMRELERVAGGPVATVLPPGPLTTARDGGVFAWHEFLFGGTVLNARDRVGDAGLYATLHEVHATNSALGAAGDWQDVSALAIELRRRDTNGLVDTFAWPHTGLGDDQVWFNAIVDTLAGHGLLHSDPESDVATA